MPARIVVDTRHVRDFGIGTYIRNLVHALAKLDSDNHYLLVTYSADTQEWSGLPPNFELAIYERKDSELFDQVAFPLYLRGLHANLYHVPLNVISLLMPTPYVVTVHDMSSLLYDEMPARRHRFRRYQFRRGLERAGRIIAVSNATQRDIEGLFGINARKIRQIYNAPDPQFLAAGPDPSDPEQQLTLERYQIRRPFLLYVGTIRPQKNIPRLVEAFAVLRAELEGHPTYGNLRLIIIGDEISRHPEVRRTVIQTRVEQAVRFLGFVPFDTLRTFYASAAAFVFPSLYEGFGLPPAGGHGFGHSRRDLQRQFPSRSCGRLGRPGQSRERVRNRPWHPGSAHQRVSAAKPSSARATSRRANSVGRPPPGRCSRYIGNSPGRCSARLTSTTTLQTTATRRRWRSRKKVRN